MEGKNVLKKGGKLEFEEGGGISGLLLMLCEGFFHTGKVVILDSNFYILITLITLKKEGFHASTLIKKEGTDQSSLKVISILFFVSLQVCAVT